jgi:uncharacterized protein with PQ loop repeat
MIKPWVEAIGWASTALLLMTLMRQVYTEWQSGCTAGLSKWLFVGQISASIGFTVYSWLLHNWVFMGSNAAILIVAIVGQLLYMHNRRKLQGAHSAAAKATPIRKLSEWRLK